jgi:hypothetical protein
VVFVRGRRTIYGHRSLHALRTALDDALGNARLQAMLETLIERERT